MLELSVVRKNEVYRYLLPKTLRLNDLKFRHVSVFGPPDTGKTTFCLSLARQLEKVLDYNGYPFLAIRAMYLGDVFEYLKEEPPLNEMYLYILIDDAERFAPSIRSRQALSAIYDHDMIRHTLKSLGLRRGFITIVYATQRFKNIQATLRNADIIVFKGINLNDSYEVKTIAEIIGWWGVYKLRDIMEKIRGYQDEKAKGLAVIKLVNGRRKVVYLEKDDGVENYVDLWTMRLNILIHGKSVDEDIQPYLPQLHLLYKNIHGVKRRIRNNRIYYYVTREFLENIGVHGLTLTRLYKISGKLGHRVKMNIHGRRLAAIKYTEEEYRQLVEWLAGLFQYSKYSKIE